MKEQVKSQSQNGNVEVKAEQPKQAVAEQPKAAEPVVRKTPVNERKYKLVAAPSVPPKGRQRQIVLEILREANRPMTIDEVTKLATEKGLYAVGGVGPSCRYHLHHLNILGCVTIENPTTGEVVAAAVEQPATK